MRDTDLILFGTGLWAVAIIFEIGNYPTAAMVCASFGGFVLGFRDGRFGGKYNA